MLKSGVISHIEGNINDFYEVSDFLADYLDTAKEIAEDATSAYWSTMSDYDGKEDIEGCVTMGNNLRSSTIHIRSG